MKSLRKKLRGRYFRKVIIYFLTWCMVLNTSLPAVLAEVVLQPDGVKNGNITVTPLGGGITQDMTASDGAIGHFSDFDIAAGHAVTCVQPGANANALFRIFSGDGTQILGQFDANGNVFLIDPAGILFGANSQVNVNRLVASSLDVSNQDFLDGRYEFFAGAGNIGTIVNNGTINAAEGVALIGKKIINTNTITTNPGGFVVMAAGDRVLLGEPGSKIVVEMDSVTLTDPENPEGFGEVVNEGQITAPGGTVVLAAGDIFSTALNVRVENGVGLVVQDGDINADSDDGDGGSVSLTSGDKTVLGSTSQTTANAGTNGNGGQVVVYSPGSAIFKDGARVEAKGGSESGNGGFFELSGKEYVEIFGDIDLTAMNGRSGMFLIDPLNLEIVAGTASDPVQDPPGTWKPSSSSSKLGIDTLETFLDSSNVTLSTLGTDGLEEGDITFNAGRYLHSGSYLQDGSDASGPTDNSLIVRAYDDIIFNADNGIDFAGDGHVELYAGPEGSVKFVNSTTNTGISLPQDLDYISTTGGDIIIEAGRGGIDVGILQTGHPSLSDVRPGEIRLQTIKGDEGVAADGEYNITTGHINIKGKGYGSVYVNSDGDLTINGDQSLGGAIHVKTNAIADDEDALSFICLTAEKNVTINSTGDKGILAEAHGNRESVASIWIGAGTNVRDGEDGHPGTVTLNCDLEADASSPGSEFVKTDATIRVYGSNINLNGNNLPNALAGGSIKYQNNVSDYVDSDDAVYEAVDPDPPNPDPLYDELISGSRALVDIDITKDGTCLNCGNVQRKVLPIAIPDWLTASKNIMVYAVVVLGNDKESQSADEGSLDDGMVYLESFKSTNNSTIDDNLTLVKGDTEVQYTPPDGWEDEFNNDGEYTDTFYYYAVDSDGDVSEDYAWVEITLINQLPEAVADNYTDSHNLVLDVDEATGVILGAGTDSDLDGDKLTVELLDGPAFGDLVLEDNGTFTYTPDETKMLANTTLEDDSFTYTLSDGFGGTDTATVTIDLTNQTPVANPDFYDVDPGTALVTPVNQGTIEGLRPDYHDFDLDNENPDKLFDDIITAVLDNGGTTAMGGTVDLKPDGSFTYTPPAGFSGPDSFSYHVTDGYGNSKSVEVTMYVGSPPVTAVPYIQPAPGLEREVIEISGCPALVKWVASELGTDERNVQIWVGNSLASTGNIQPCDACEDLKTAATILQDVDGTRVAALANVINEFASSTAPPTEEQMASIADAIANDIEGNRQYAAAGEYLDALAQYVSILNSEIGFSADESIQFATDNYVEKLVEGENMGVAAYVAARLAALGGS